MLKTTFSAESAYRDLQRIAESIKAGCEELYNRTGNLSAVHIDEFMNVLVRRRTRLQELRATPGLDLYVSTAHPDDPDYDFPAEYTAMDNAIVSTGQWVATNIPADVDGYELTYTRNAQGLRVPREFNSTATAAFKAEILNIINAVE